MTTPIDHRQAEVAWANWAVANHQHFNYSEGSDRMAAIGVWPIQFPVNTDCSGSCTLYAWWANGNDPNGLGFDHEGYTGTFLTHEEHIPLLTKTLKGITIDDIEVGDYVVYGEAPGEHVAIIVEIFGEDVLTVSFGQQGGPGYCWVNPPKVAPSQGYPSDGRTPQTYLRNITNNNKPVRLPPTTK